MLDHALRLAMITMGVLLFRSRIGGFGTREGGMYYGTSSSVESLPDTASQEFVGCTFVQTSKNKAQSPNV